MSSTNEAVGFQLDSIDASLRVDVPRTAAELVDNTYGYVNAIPLFLDLKLSPRPPHVVDPSEWEGYIAHRLEIHDMVSNSVIEFSRAIGIPANDMCMEDVKREAYEPSAPRQ